jgi:hypothetical protein
MKYRIPKKSIVAPLRIPEEIYILAMRRCDQEDLDFSKFARRAIRRDLERCGLLQSEVPA